MQTSGVGFSFLPTPSSKTPRMIRFSTSTGITEMLLGEYWQTFYLILCISHFVDCFQYSIVDSIMDVKHRRCSSSVLFLFNSPGNIFWVAWHSLHHFFKVVPLGNTKQHCSREIRDTSDTAFRHFARIFLLQTWGKADSILNLIPRSSWIRWRWCFTLYDGKSPPNHHLGI